ncbi:hypothetical protein Golob_013501 [Gossypium lobatum]|uniref:Uncharacterized protein n=1 Tax=Gossypium lobatum TaxID=34289 RepID=A0A7J8LPN0_9ROSI|nr:hypothetical protein [Gossypium lobatum]
MVGETKTSPLRMAMVRSLGIKKEFDRKWVRKLFIFKDMLSAVEEWVVKLKESMMDMKDSVNAAMVMALKEETIATTNAFSILIGELEGELALCRATVRNGVVRATLNSEDVPKLKEFTRTISACDVDNCCG